MPIIPTNTDYTDKDFDSLRFRLRNLIRSVFPEWTDFNVANFGNILLELYAHVGDILAFYQDNQARQSRITTATQRRALLGLVKLIGFEPATATPATVDVTISLPTPPVGSVTIPKGSFVSTEQVTTPVRYQLLANAFIAAGANPATVTVSTENSEPQEQAFASTGLPNQTFLLTSTPYIDMSAVVTAGNGTYTEVDNFLSSLPTDKHFTVVVDQNDRATIRFGNAVNGTIPVGTISVAYKTGGGSAGRVEANKLKKLEGTFTDSLGNPVNPTVTNAQPSSGGTDRQSVAQIKERAPATLRVLNRTVAREDYEINALRLPAVARALMLTRNEDVSIAENAGELYIVPVGGGLPSAALKTQVLNQVTVVFPNTLTFDAQVRDPVYKDVSIAAVVHIRQGQNKPAAKTAILAALASFFSVQNADGTANTNIDFGGKIRDDAGNVTPELALSDILNAIRDVAAVRKVGAEPGNFLINGVYDDVTLTTKEFPRLGTVTLTDGDTGLPL